MRNSTIPTHPLYADYYPLWEQMTDTYLGEHQIKNQGRKYLPETEIMSRKGMENISDAGYKDYQAYKNRAVFPELVKNAVDAMVGLIFKKSPKIVLPDKLKAMLEFATPFEESLEMLLRKIIEHQLVYGRVGLLMDIGFGTGVALPTILLYKATSVVNWDDTYKFVFLNEDGYVSDETFQWKFQAQNKLCILNENTYKTMTINTGLEEYNETLLVPVAFKGKTLDFIPFVFVNSNDLSPNPDSVPLLGLSNIALTIYRGEADYRQALFMQGQETLVLKNVDSDGKNSDWVVGSSAILFLPRADSDAFYLSTDGTGIGAMRQALLDDRLAAGEFGIKLTDDSTTSQSGEAMRVRMASKTASLTGIAKTGAEGLKQVLKYCAEIVGANPDEIEIEIDADFSAERIGGQELAQYMTAINEGAPLAKESLHSKLKEGGITEKTYEEEIALIEKEKEDQGLVTEMTQTVPTESPDLQQGDEEEQATQNPEKNQQTN